jgi:hypothetical protein
MICSETVDALMNEKIGTSERIVRSLAAKLGFAGATAGLFSIASVFGTAGTGTAIATLSGAAFNSAALKWLGGGISMAVGGWIVFLISLVVGVLSYVLAILTFRKFKGSKRKLKNLDSQEKRVVETLMLISIGFRAQADQKRHLDPISAAVLQDKVFGRLCDELQICIQKVRYWPAIPREKLRKQVGKISELNAFLSRTAQVGGQRARLISGAERADIVPVVVLKLMSKPVPALNAEEKLVLEALRRANKRKLKKASLDTLAEYFRLERIDRLAAQLEKARRIYRKLTTRSKSSSSSEEYTVAFVEDPERAGVTVLIQSLITGETSTSHIQGADHRKLFDDSQASKVDASTTSNGMESHDLLNGSGRNDWAGDSELLENLSIAAMITLAKNAGGFLSGRAISKQQKNKLVKDGVVTISVAGLSQLIL